MSQEAPFSRFIVYYIIVWLAIWIPLRYYTPLTFTVRHSYQLPSAACTETLISDFNAWETVREGLFELLILVPFSLCFMVWSREIIGWRIQIIVSFFGILLALVMFGFDIRDMIYANVGPTDVNFNIANLARDTRWCLVYFNQPGADLFCTMTAACTGSAVDANSLMVNGPFTYRFGLNIFLIIMIGYSFWLSYIWKKKMIDELVPVEPQKIKYLSRFEMTATK